MSGPVGRDWLRAPIVCECQGCGEESPELTGEAEVFNWLSSHRDLCAEIHVKGVTLHRKREGTGETTSSSSANRAKNDGD